MNLFETLKQFKNIEPSADFSATSKRSILAQAPAMTIWTARRVILRVLETGVAVALTGFFILLVTGGLESSKFAPVQYSAINPQSLHAEAEAIDMQIQLANLNYAESSAAQSTVASPSGAKPSAQAIITAPISSTSTTSTAETDNGGSASSTGAVTTTVSIDQALQGLSN